MTNLPYKLFLFLIMFSPLAFGAVEPWSLFIMEITALLALTIMLIRNIQNRKPLADIPGLIPLLALLSYMGFQLLPLPPGLIRILSPETYALYRDSAWATEPAYCVSLSISRKAGLEELFRFSAYACMYILSVQLLSRSGLFRRTVIVIAVFGSLLALFSILQHLVPNNRIYWLRELTKGGIPFGPYVNRNHYAGLMGMIFPVIVSLFIYYRPRLGDIPIRKKLAAYFTHPQSNLFVLLGFSAILAGTSVFLSLSRGGIASLLMAAFFLGLLLAKRSGQSRHRHALCRRLVRMGTGIRAFPEYQNHPGRDIRIKTGSLERQF